MLRLVDEDLDNSQPGCCHMSFTQVGIKIKFVPFVANEGRMLSCEAEVSNLSWTIASSQSSVYELPRPWNDVPPVFH